LLFAGLGPTLAAPACKGVGASLGWVETCQKAVLAKHRCNRAPDQLDRLLTAGCTATRQVAMQCVTRTYQRSGIDRESSEAEARDLMLELSRVAIGKQVADAASRPGC